MATITSALLSISHNHLKRTATPVVKTTIQFNNIELQAMHAFPGRWFKLKCELWGKDTLPNEDQKDDLLFTYPEVYYFPDRTQTAIESRTFQHVIGEGLL